MTVMAMAGGAVKRVVLEVLGWTLLLGGLAAIFLPGPGLLGIFGGLALLSRRYEWAQRRVEPARLRAMGAAADSVATWPRIVGSLTGVAVLAASGVLWILSPPAPGWWSFPDTWWLPGGLWTGLTQVVSAAIALALIVYSYRRFHGKPEAVTALHQDTETAREASREASRRRRDKVDR